jgi:hypothetical protein
VKKSEGGQEMTTEQKPPGCIAVPVLIVVVPLRLLWELLRAVGRFTGAYVLRPIAIALYHVLLRPLAWLLKTLWQLFRALMQGVAWLFRTLGRPLWWLLRVLVLIPLVWSAEEVLAPVAEFVWSYVLRPFGIALGWTLRMLVTPFVYAVRWLALGLAALWRLLVPALVVIGRGIAYCWHLAGLVLFHVFVRPAVWTWRTLVMPVLRAVAAAWRATVVPAARWFGSHVWEPARAAARSVSRALGLDTRAR